MFRSTETNSRERGTERDRDGSRNHGHHSDDDRRDDRRNEGAPARDRGRGNRLTGPKAALLARQQLEELTGMPVETVSGLARHDDGWAVMVEIMEMERVPSTTDILASYRVELDQNGDLVGYERVSRYYRNQAGGE
jgi:hypothetical protein